jgi:Na+/H+ antiporter NhaD/arsenite permease-like protein
VAARILRRMPEFTWLRLVALVAFERAPVLLFKTVVPGFGEPALAWLILAMASTLAGNLTIIGSVANLIVVEAARQERITIEFWEYARVGIPVTL